MRCTLVKELFRNLSLTAALAVIVGAMMVPQIGYSGAGQVGTAASITWDHTDSAGNVQAFYDDDNFGKFTQNVQGTQAVITSCSGICNGDFLFDTNYFSGKYTKRTFFVDLSHPAGTNASFGAFHNLANFHMKIPAIGLYSVGQVGYAYGYFASDLGLNTSLNSYKIQFDVTAGVGTPVQVTRVSSTQWAVVANAAVGDTANLNYPTNRGTTNYGNYLVPFSATITTP